MTPTIIKTWTLTCNKKKQGNLVNILLLPVYIPVTFVTTALQTTCKTVVTAIAVAVVVTIAVAAAALALGTHRLTKIQILTSPTCVRLVTVLFATGLPTARRYENSPTSVFNPLRTKRICFRQGLSAYRAVNTLRFGYKNQSLNVL
jgi:hypothetical protein